MVTPAARREAVAHLQSAHRMSERRAVRVVGADRASVRYRSRRPDDGPLRERLKALAQERRRSAIGGCTSCSGAKAMRSTRSACSGSIARRS
jgi:hypothetical protein